jgi:uncharacterized protein YhbP (UPF0306 family)
MDQEELKQRAKNFIRSQRICSIATTDGNEPWITPTRYIADEKNNIYVLLSIKSKSVSNIENSNIVAVSIVTKVPESIDKLRTIQCQGKVSTVSGEELKDVFEQYEVSFPGSIDDGETFKNFQGKNVDERFIKITPSTIYFLDPEYSEERVKIVL